MGVTSQAAGVRAVLIPAYGQSYKDNGESIGDHNPIYLVVDTEFRVVKSPIGRGQQVPSLSRQKDDKRLFLICLYNTFGRIPGQALCKKSDSKTA